MDLKCMECQWMNMVSRISSRECDVTVYIITELLTETLE